MAVSLVDVFKNTLLLTSYSYAAIVGCIYILQRKLQYFPTASAPPDVCNLAHTYQDMEDFQVLTTDGLPLRGWLWREQNSKIFVLHLHGNAGNRFHRLHWASAVKRTLSCTIALFDYRGFGGNPGSISEQGLTKDALAAILWANAEAERSNQKLVLHLESIGSVAGLSALAKISAVNVCGIVVEGGLSSCYDLACSMLPYMPVKLLMRDKWNQALMSARGLRREIHFLSLHGAADRIVPIWCGVKLFDAVACEHKRFVTFRSGDHNDLIFQPGYFEALRNFYAEVEEEFDQTYSDPQQRTKND